MSDRGSDGEPMRLIRLAVSESEDGVIEVSSLATDTHLRLPKTDVALLIEALQNLDRTGNMSETIFLDPSS